MDTSYDEDISENPFFVEFQTEHPELLNQCIAEGWVLCVPRVSTVVSQIFTLQDFLGHILVCNDELPTTHFMTLTDKTIRVVDRIITLEQNNSELPSEIHILFEETFYTADKVKYKVWCIEFPLELEHTSKLHPITLCKVLKTLRDCIDFLWTETSGKEVLEFIDLEIEQCKLILSQTQSLSIYTYIDIVDSLYAKCLQITMKSKQLKEKCKSCKSTMDNVKLAVETYMHHGIYKELFEALCMCTAYDDSNLNKIIRNSSDIQVQDLEVKQRFLDCIPIAKRNVSLIQSYSTVLGKVSCIRNTIATINKTSNTSTRSDLYVSTDDLLPILIFLVLKSSIPNWLAHLYFLKHFRCSVHKFFESDESSFCISTLEAVIEQIKCGLFTLCPHPESQHTNNNDDDDESFELLGFGSEIISKNKDAEKECSSNLQYLFEQVKLSNIDKVKEILERNKNRKLSSDTLDSTNSLNLSDMCLEDVFNEDSSEDSSVMCHPLCICTKCCKVVSNNLLKSSPTVSSRDSHGFTVLHIASIHNKIRIIDLILEMGADVDSTDYSGSTPLHYAASKGHQTAMLLFLHVGADVNKPNMNKNTPLHLACNNGHASCVKALIYFCEQSKNILNLQAINDNGDTPLHLSSKWGYQTIVRVLLDNGAEPWIKNNKGKTPIDYSHSRITTNLLLSVMPNMLEYVNVSFDIDKIVSPIKSDVVLLDLNEENPEKQNEIAKKISSLMSLAEAVKPKSTVDIHHIERLFRAVSFGDVKLACFYMNIDYDSNCEIGGSEKNDIEKSEINLCHPLCACVKCSRQKPLEKDLSFNVNMCDSNGDTSLHIAVKHYRLEICDILLNNGAIPNIKNNMGTTPLHIAAKENKVDIMKKLLKHLNNIEARDASGNTPLHLACKAGSVEAVRLLLKVEPYKETMNLSQRTPLDEAKDQIHLTIIDLLEESLKKNL